jgi:hypothetical protein
MRLTITPGIALALAACAPTPGPDGNPAADGPAGACDAAPAQELLGERASPEAGQRLLRLTGATQLRWAPPRSAMTMDFRTDRLTVEYDDTMIITRVACG